MKKFLPVLLCLLSFYLEAGRRPNILLFIVDEQRYPVQYETEELREWKEKNLSFQKMLAEQGYVFHNHYTNTIACTPARTTLHTGQYPNVHGVTQTDGIAKDARDSDMTWLAPFTVPTMGNYLQAAGYQTILKGKWHVSDAGIRNRDGSYLTTYDAEGKPLAPIYRFYREKNVLHDYGYDHWMGPEPHGFAALNSGGSIRPPAIGRDTKCTQEVLEELALLEEGEKPWFLVASYVNPHDITVYGLYTRLASVGQPGGWLFPVDPSLPEQLFEAEFQASLEESLVDKPPVQLSYRDLYGTAFQPILNIDRFQRVYYTLQRKVDGELQRVMDWLKASSMYENTIILFTSDHGELLASHGKMFQKWHQAYQEAIHVPLIISSPLLEHRHEDIHNLTAHVDVMPTILDFARVDVEKVREELGKKFSLNLPLPGKSLVPLLKNGGDWSSPVYFYTEDDPTRGSNQVSAICAPYNSVLQPSSVEAVLTYIDGDLWKLTHYYSIYSQCDNTRGIAYEMYNLSKDPLELTSYYNSSDYANTQTRFLSLLNQCKVQYRAVG